MTTTGPDKGDQATRDDAGESPIKAGIAAHRRGDLDEALRLYTVAVTRGEGLSAAYTNTAQILRARGKFDAAVIAGRRALAVDPGNASALNTLANSLVDSGHPKEAIDLFRRAIEMEQGRNPRTMGNLGIGLRRLGKLRDSLACFDRALALEPNNNNIVFHRAMALLQLGDFQRGWPAYESRWGMNPGERRRKDEPIWDGTPFPGRKLLIHAEQGFGDMLQFCRFVAAVKARGGTVIVECQPELLRLMRSLAGADEVVARGATAPQTDLHIPVASLPLALGIGIDQFAPTIPYLTTPPEARAKFAGRLANWRDRFKVGIVWSGSVTFIDNVNRCTELEDFLGLAAIPGVQLFSLQKGAPAADRNKAGAIAPLLIDATGEFDDFADTAGFIEGLDLVIMTDSSVAHLTGAIGRPVWTLLMRTPDWRWLIDRNDTPWYPSMRLFSQPRFGDWNSVFRDVAKALREEVARAGLGEAAPKPTPLPAARNLDEAMIELDSVQRDASGKPRFKMQIPRALATDAGLRLLINQETRSGGFEYATRRFLEEHLSPGSVFLDVGAHWGVYALTAATQWRGLIDVLAVEPSAVNAKHFRLAVERNGLADRVELVEAAAGARPGRVRLSAEGGTMGHRVREAAADAPSIPMVTIDGLLAKRRKLRGRPVFMKIDVEGLEPQVIAGARQLIATGEIQAIIWERGRNFNREPYRTRLNAMVEMLDTAGFSMWRLPHEVLGGPLVPWVPTDDLCNVFALPSDFQRRPCYGPPPAFKVSRPFKLAGERSLEARIADTELLIAYRGTDCQRWADIGMLEDGADARAVAAANFIRAGASVLDLGAGLMRLRERLPAKCRYLAVDLVPFRAQTVVVDFNQGNFPTARADCAVALSVLPFIHGTVDFLARMRAAAGEAIITYPVAGAEPIATRRAAGYFNDLDLPQLTKCIQSAGWTIASSTKLGDETLFYLVS